MVKFNRSHGSYNAGEIAKFSDAHEEWLVKKNLAVPFKAARKEEPVAKSSGNEKDDKQPPQQSGGGKGDPGAPQTRQTTVGPQDRR